MVESIHNGRMSAEEPPSEAAIAAARAREWFGCEVLPLEASLMQYLEHNWRNASDIADLRQEVYVRLYSRLLRDSPNAPGSLSSRRRATSSSTASAMSK